jgi:hypothetical protein
MPRARADTCKNSVKNIIEAIEKSGQDIYKKKYNLYEITKELEEIVPSERIRKTKKIDKISQIIKIIEYIKENNLI